jgi:hypothetical protein
MEARDLEDVLYGNEGLSSNTPDAEASGPTPAAMSTYHTALLLHAIASVNGDEVEAVGAVGALPALPDRYPAIMGKWLSADLSGTVLGRAGDLDYVYVHTYTQELTLSRPIDCVFPTDKDTSLSSSASTRSTAHAREPPPCSISELKAKVQSVWADGKLPVLVCPTSDIHDAAVDLVQTWDGTSKGTDEWKVWFADHSAMLSERRAVFEAERLALHAQALEKWAVETAVRKEKRREVMHSFNSWQDACFPRDLMMLDPV